VSERDEQARRIAETFPGPRGPKGPRGARGKAGLEPAVKRAFAYLFLLVFALLALGFYGLYREQQADNAGLLRVQQANNRQRCGSLAEVVRIPIPVPTADNPSREAWATFEAVQRRRGRQLGCKLPPPRYAPAKPGN
jgi:hypothetical protein